MSQNAQSFLRPETDEESGLTSAKLITHYQHLTNLRHMGFIQAHNLTGQAIYELGQVKKMDFVDQVFDIDGNPTQPRMALAETQNQMISAVQELLDLLGRMERFIHAPETPDRATEFEKAKTNYETKLKEFKDSADPHHQPIALNFSQVRSAEAFDGVSFDANGYASLGEALRREVTDLLSTLNSYNDDYTEAQGYLLSGPVSRAAKKALSATQGYDFPLSAQTAFEHDLLDPTAGQIALSLKDYTPDPFDDTELLRMQRCTTFLNKNPQTLNATVVSTAFSEPGTRSWLGSTWLNLSVAKHRLSGIDHPSNKTTRITLPLFKLAHGAALLADSLFGLVAGVFNQNFSFFRTKANQLQFKTVPTDPDEKYEYDLIHQISHKPTLLNKVGKWVPFLVKEVFSNALYSLKTVWNGTLQLLTDNLGIRWLRNLFRPEPNPNTVLTNLLEKLKTRETAKVRPYDQVPTDEPSATTNSSITQITLSNPLDFYQQSDVFGGIASAFSSISSGLHQFIVENPTLSAVLCSSIVLAALPTTVKFSLDMSVKFVDGYIQEAAVKLTEPIKNSFLQSVMQKVIETRLQAKLYTENLADLANFNLLDIKELLETEVKSLKKETWLTVSDPAQMGKVVGNKMTGEVASAWMKAGDGDDDDSTPDPTASYADTEVDGRADPVNGETKPHPDSGGVADMGGEALDHAEEEDEDEEAGDSSETSRAQSLAVQILENVDKLSSLSQVDKDDFCRALLAEFPSPEHREFVELIIRECQKIGPITAFGKTLPMSELAASVTQGIKHVFNFLGLVSSLLRLLLIAPYHWYKGNDNLSLRKTTLETKQLFVDSWAKVTSFVGNVLFGTVNLITGLAFRMVPATVDQLVRPLRILTKKLWSLFTTAAHRQGAEPLPAANGFLILRAKASAGLYNLTSRLSAGLSSLFGTRASKISAQKTTLSEIPTSTALATTMTSTTIPDKIRTSAQSEGPDPQADPLISGESKQDLPDPDGVYSVVDTDEAGDDLDKVRTFNGVLFHKNPLKGAIPMMPANPDQGGNQGSLPGSTGTG